MENKIEYSKPVPPFVRFCAANIPMVFDDSLSYYEALCALWKWLQTDVIDVINNNAAVTDYYIAYDQETRAMFVELKDYVDNYFANLDVQEEINNKLDAMAEDGSLEEILRSAFTRIPVMCIARDTLYDTLDDAITDCLTNNYILYLTDDYQINEDAYELPSIIGNGHTITYGGTGLITNGKTIKGVNFVWDTTSTETGKQNGLRATSSTIENCTFTGFVSPCKIMGNNPKVSNCKFIGTAQGVYVSEAYNAVVTGISFNNTAEERTTWRTNLSSKNGMDGVLVEDSENVVISDSYFTYCTERILYAYDSNNVDIHNIRADYCDGIKFCGYDSVVSNFNANNIVLKNSFDDAFCQLYMVSNVNITGCEFYGEVEPNYIGWFVRAGHHVEHVNLVGNKCDLVRRSFFTYQDTFPDSISEHDYVCSDINISNNTVTNMSLISNLHYPAVDIQDATNAETHTVSGFKITGNRFSGYNIDKMKTFNASGKVLSCLMYCKYGTDIFIKDNILKGVISTCNLTGSDLTGSTQIELYQDIYFENINLDRTYVAVDGKAVITVYPFNYNKNSVEVDGYIKYTITDDNISGEFFTNYYNRAIWLTLPAFFNITGDVYNTDEMCHFYVYNDTPAVDGTKISNTNGSTNGIVYFYKDGNNYIVRTRDTRTLLIRGTVAGKIISA